MTTSGKINSALAPIRDFYEIYLSPQRLIYDPSQASEIPSKYRLFARIFLAISPVLIVQVLFYFLFYNTGQMEDILLALNTEPVLQWQFALGFFVNTFLSSIIIIWRIHQVEDPFIEITETSRFFLISKCVAILLCLGASVLLNPVMLEANRQAGEITYTLFAGPYVVAGLALVVFAVYVFLDVPSLHRHRRGQPKGWTPPFWFHYVFLWMAAVAAVFLVVAPSLSTAVLGAPVALFTFVWVMFMAVFWFKDLSALGRILGLVLLVIVVSGPHYAVRDMRQNADLSVAPAPLDLPEEGPIFLIASDGGGIRASYWTTVLLGEIAAQPDYADFADRIVAYGGTSGGSVGVGLFAALVNADVPAAELGDTAKAILSVDYVSLAATHLFWRDFVVSAFCKRAVFSWTSQCSGMTDRITAIETRMEAEFEAATGKTTLGGAVPSNPRMFFIATEVGTGRAYALTTEDVGFQPTDSGVPTAGTLIALGVPMSTAMFVSARFPVVSPDARIRVTKTGTVASPGAGDGAYDMHLIDGGYADNTGSIALTQLIEAGAFGNAVEEGRLYALTITNDPTRRGADTTAFEDFAPCDRPPRAGGDGDALRLVASPIVTLEGVRARASEAQRARFHEALPDTALTVPFIGCRGETAVPLGWTLSQGAREIMDAKAKTLLTPGSPLVDWLDEAYGK